MFSRIKFCGMTRAEDAFKAAELGVDAIGLIFYSKSPRFVTIKQAAPILAALPPFVTSVAVVVNALPAEITKIISELPIDVLQFHGDETPEECVRYGKPYIKAVRVQANTDIEHIAAQYATAKAILLDTYDPEQMGGSGKLFDWGNIPKQLSSRLILAGGLTADNVATAIEMVKPYAVDVSSGVESSPGIKDHNKMAAFIREVTHAQRN